MFKECETEEHRALKEQGLESCPRCGYRLRVVIPYKEFRQKYGKKYGRIKDPTEYPDEYPDEAA